MIRKFFKQDSMLLGIILGLAVPGIIYFLLHGIINHLIPYGSIKMPLVKTSTLQLVAIFTNLLTMRYYLLRLKFDFTGRGILLSTMILAIFYFAIYL